MTSALSQMFFFVLLLLGIYFFSRQTINELFYFLQIFFRKNELVFSLISLIFLPGTIIHELAHFLAAMILMLKVSEVRILPEIDKDNIRLGSVVYEKKDIIRSILVGLAPIFLALSIFWILANFHVFPGPNIYFNALMVYVLFTISSTMFSSKKDLQDLIFVFPLIVIISAIVYIFDIRVDMVFRNKILMENIANIIKQVNYYLVVSLLINIVLIVFFKSLRFVLKK